MKKTSATKALVLAAAMLLGHASCSDDERDMERPTITTEGITAQPAECDAYRIGDVIQVCYRLTDNEELGNFNLEIHSNHDHHTHSTSAVECDPDPVSHPDNPWVFNHDYAIPSGMRDYTIHEDIPVPDGIAPGDYHFMIRVTDRAGWQELRSMAIKIQ
ncbi:MAG: DUF4625 domain-containing protein [Bacteroidales bacterium]|nr:DUF4625 domain-containing protein [Bacteroidales bacterium]